MLQTEDERQRYGRNNDCYPGLIETGVFNYLKEIIADPDGYGSIY